MDKSNSRKLQDEATHLLENNRYADARDAYRKAAIVELPTRDLLISLRVAEELEQLEFSQHLRDKYPHSLIIAEYDINNLLQLDSQWTAHAVLRCTELLQTSNLEPTEELKLHNLRFYAVTRASYYAARDATRLFIEDFSEVWRTGANTPLARRLRRQLLSNIASMNEHKGILLLEALMKEQWLPTNIRNFLQVKLEELRFLEQIDSD